MNHMHFENRKQSRSFFLFIWIMYTVYYMTKNCFSAAMASIVFERILTKSQTGLITALFYVVYTPFQIVGGFAADKFDPERLIKIGLIGAGIANLIIFFNQSYFLVLIVWTLNAMIQFGIWPSIFKIISSQLEPHERRNAIYYISFSNLPSIMLAYFVAAIVPTWRYNFIVSAIVLFVSAVALHFITKNVQSYMVNDGEIKTAEEARNTEAPVSVSTGKLFLESGFYILLTVVLVRMLILACTTTLSATMLMECYDHVSPSIGNYITVVINGIGIIATILVKTVLYPKRIKSAPTGILFMVAITLFFAVPLIFVGKVSIMITVLSLCVMTGSLTASQLFMNYCSLRFEKFGKSGIASGITNAVVACAIALSSYGVTKTAENYSWQTVSGFFVVMLVIAFVLSLAAIPFWKRFKKKYHANSPHPLTQHTG